MSRLRRVLELGECYRQLELKRNPRDACLQAYDMAVHRDLMADPRKADRFLRAVSEFMRSDFFTYEKHMPACLDETWLDDLKDAGLFELHVQKFNEEFRRAEYDALYAALKKMIRYFEGVNGGDLQHAGGEHFKDVGR